MPMRVHRVQGCDRSHVAASTGKGLIMSDPLSGVVKFFDSDRGFGFVTLDTDGSDVFIHISGMRPGQNYPNTGDKVSLEVVAGQKGPMGKDVTITEVNPEPPRPRGPRPPSSDDRRPPRPGGNAGGGWGRDGGRDGASRYR